MKRDSLIYAIGAFVAVAAALMKISHIPGAQIAGLISMASIAFIIVYLAIQNRKFKNEADELKK